ERLMGKQINLYLELQMARAKTRQISVPEYDQIRVCLNAFKIWVGEESMIDSISPDRWEAWYVHLLSADISIEYKKKQFRHARNFLMWLAEKGLIQPALNLHARRYRFTGGHKKVPTIPVDEVRKILTKTQGILQLHLLLFLNCGMTQQDVSDLHPGEVDWEAGRITRRRSKTEKMEQTPIVCYKLWNETFRLLTKFGHREGEGAIRKNRCLGAGFLFSHTPAGNRRFPTLPSQGERPCPSANPANGDIERRPHSNRGIASRRSRPRSRTSSSRSKPNAAMGA